MSARIENTRGPRDYTVDATSSAERPAETSTQRPNQDTPKSGLGRGSAALLEQYSATNRGGSARAAEERVNAARNAIRGLASQLPGHGVDLDAFAAGFGTAKYAAFGKDRVAAAAVYGFVRAALTQNPKLADRAIAIRSNGLSSTDRELVGIVVARSGATGLVKYAECERVLRAIQPFSAEERKDIAGLVRAGAGIDAAVAEERKTLGRIAKEEAASRAAPSLRTQRSAAVKRAQTEATRWAQVSQHMNTAIRSVPRLSRGAEVAVGLGAATGTVGSLAWNSGKSLVTGGPHAKRALEEADNAGGYIAGELSAKIEQADRLYLDFTKQHAEYAERNASYQRAVRDGDYDEINAAGARLKSLATEMTKTVRAFDAVAKKLEVMNDEFNAAAAHAAVHLAVSSIAVGLAIGKPARHGIAEAIKEGIAHPAKEAAIAEGIGKAAH